MARFCPIASGSNGNCLYVGYSGTHFLVDAGVSGKRAESWLAGMNILKLDGIFVTHEHSDHISGVGVLARRFSVPVYATPKTWRYLCRHNKLGPLADSQICMVEPGVPAQIAGVEVTPFDIPHDASQPVGYTFRAGGVKVSVATDMGQATDTVRAHIRGSHILLLESNHDLEMLKNGRYPRPLKERVLGARGHLSNAAAGRLLSEVACAELAYAFLGHLSEDNNRPMIALDTVRRILESEGVELKHLAIAGRDGPGDMVEAE